MSKINYYILRPNNEKSLIYISTYVNTGEVQISTGENIDVKFWNNKTKRVTTKGYPKGNGTNTVLDSIESIFNKQKNIFIANGKAITKDDVKFIVAAARNQTNPTKPEIEPLTFWQYFDEFLTKERFTKDGLPIKKQSYNAYFQTYQRLKDFEKAKKIKITFDVLDKSTLEKFVSFLYRKHNDNFSDKDKKGLTPNTVALTIRRLKTVIGNAIDDGFTVPSSHRKVKVSSVETTEIALTENELMQLFHFDLSNNSNYDKVRDLFLIGCYTALRFSDYSKVSYSNVKQWHKGTDIRNYLSITTEKTGQTVAIPILPVVESILKKYDGQLPKPYPNQVMNRYLKEIGKMVGFDAAVKVTEYDKGQRVENNLEQWQMLSTHTARRTGATLMYNQTNDIYLCMALTGHKSEKQFQRYIRNNELDNMKKLDLLFKDTGFGQIYDPKDKIKSPLRIVA